MWRFSLVICILIIKRVNFQVSVAYNCNRFISSPLMCLTCNIGYYQIGKICVLKGCEIPNCEVCLDNSSCFSCEQGYYLNQAMTKCNPCPLSCRNCILNSKNLVCLKCGNSDWDGSSCLTPMSSLCLGIKKPVSCPLCGNLCKTCYLDSSNQVICSICSDLSVFDNSNPSSCVCKSDSTLFNDSCKLCKEIHGLSCIRCNKDQCLSCYSQKHCILFNGKCLCDYYFTGIQSNTFLNPAVYQVNTTKSIQVFYHNSSCALLDNDFNCIHLCKDLYDNCNVCNGVNNLCYKNQTLNLVKSCPSNSYLDETNQCTLCSTKFANCVDCTQMQCLTCVVNGTLKQCSYTDQVNGFQNSSLSLQNNQQSSCSVSKNCLKCEGLLCVECNDGYFMSNSTCKNCAEVFSLCDACTSLKCSKCKDKSSFDKDNNCLCESMFISVGDQCFSGWVIIGLPIIAFIIIIVIIKIILYFRSRKIHVLEVRVVVPVNDVNEEFPFRDNLVKELEFCTAKLDANNLNSLKEIPKEKGTVCQTCKDQVANWILKCHHKYCALCLLNLIKNSNELCYICRIKIEYTNVSRLDKKNLDMKL